MSAGRAGRLREQAGSTGTRRVPSFPAKRVCAENGCQTILSIYNGDAFCFLHEPPRRAVLKLAP